ncbi:putative radial spoke head 1 [Paratrimastix pyriformis]|uniref:Radial spoke head 1 n=1 Tax=Paratrimastix pyriformis TaxID=342808 RepID=A0ABQ8UUT9_9EUKA|nr:putative radial spoke head 1 [Paratrimastix pyriformis]
MAEADENAPKDLGKYEGPRDERKERHGMGKNTFPNKDVYIGEYEHGKRQGKGKYFYKADPNKIAKYDGEWVDFKKCGEGVMHFPDGSMYKGHFQDGKRHGHGVYTYPNGDTFEGEFFNGMKHGSGRYEYKQSHCVVEGVWVQNNIVRGVLRHPDGVTSYRGQFERGRPNNDGMYVFKDNIQQGRFVETVKKEEVEVPRPKKKPAEGDEGDGGAEEPTDEAPIMKTVYRIQTRQWIPSQLACVDEQTATVPPELLQPLPGELEIKPPPPPPAAPVSDEPQEADA